MSVYLRIRIHNSINNVECNRLRTRSNNLFTRVWSILRPSTWHNLQLRCELSSSSIPKFDQRRLNYLESLTVVLGFALTSQCRTSASDDEFEPVHCSWHALCDLCMHARCLHCLVATIIVQRCLAVCTYQRKTGNLSRIGFEKFYVYIVKQSAELAREPLSNVRGGCIWCVWGSFER